MSSTGMVFILYVSNVRVSQVYLRIFFLKYTLMNYQLSSVYIIMLRVLT